MKDWIWTKKEDLGYVSYKDRFQRAHTPKYVRRHLDFTLWSSELSFNTTRIDPPTPTPLDHPKILYSENFCLTSRETRRIQTEELVFKQLAILRIHDHYLAIPATKFPSNKFPSVTPIRSGTCDGGPLYIFCLTSRYKREPGLETTIEVGECELVPRVIVSDQLLVPFATQSNLFLSSGDDISSVGLVTQPSFRNVKTVAEI